MNHIHEDFMLGEMIHSVMELEQEPGKRLVEVQCSLCSTCQNSSVSHSVPAEAA